jgi:antirestriction protein ArdC
MNVSEIVTNRIIEQLEKGIIPWNKPWGSAKAINYVTRKPYKGMNILLLDQPGEYLTFNQCKAAGGSIKKGAKSKMIVFWKMYNKEVDADEADKKTKTIPVLNYYNVFHISDCDGVESKIKGNEKPELESIPDKDEFINKYMSNEQIRYEQEHSDKAYYTVEQDKIHLPLTKQFEGIAEYYSTLFHEMIHSTGHQKRLNRLELAQYHSSKEVRSKEELTAEIGAATLMNESGLESAGSFKNSTAYIQSWVSVLKNDTNMIIQASSRAQKAVDYIKSKAN